MHNAPRCHRGWNWWYPFIVGIDSPGCASARCFPPSSIWQPSLEAMARSSGAAERPLARERSPIRHQKMVELGRARRLRAADGRSRQLDGRPTRCRAAAIGSRITRALHLECPFGGDGRPDAVIQRAGISTRTPRRNAGRRPRRVIRADRTPIRSRVACSRHRCGLVRRKPVAQWDDLSRRGRREVRFSPQNDTELVWRLFVMYDI
jgi:hypothetical protein